MEFEKGFDSYVCEGDTIATKIDGITYEARIVRDEESNIDDDDSHNIDQSVTGCTDEQQAKLLAARAAWFNDKWFYCGIVISAKKVGIVIGKHLESLWGIDANYPGSDNSYLLEVANELLPEAIKEATNRVANMILDLQREEGE